MPKVVQVFVFTKVYARFAFQSQITKHMSYIIILTTNNQFKTPISQ